jgi:cytochrome c553
MKHSLFFLFAFVICIGCEQQLNTKSNSHINPNGDSELALLMRNMFSESDSLKQLVVAGKTLSGLKRFEDIHTAIATDPTVHGPVFDAFSDAYINAIKQLESSDSSSVLKFNNIVTQCMNCHSKFCPGPKKRIKQLYIQE